MCHVISLESNNWLLAVIVPEHFWFHIFCTNHNLETSESKPEDRELSAHAVRTLARSNFNQISISKFPSTTVKEIISCWSIMISSRWRQFPRKKKALQKRAQLDDAIKRPSAKPMNVQYRSVSQPRFQLCKKFNQSPKSIFPTEHHYKRDICRSDRIP